MAKKFSDLTELSTLAAADLFAVVDDNVSTSKKITAANVLDYVLGGATIGGNSAGDILTTDDAQTRTAVLTITTDAVPLLLNNTGSDTAEGLAWMFAPNLTAGSDAARIFLGKDDSEYDSGVFSFEYNADGGAANTLNIGLWGHGDTLKIDGSENVGIGKTSGGAKLDVDGEIEGTSLDINGTTNISDTLTLSKGSGSALIVSSGGNSVFNAGGTVTFNGTINDGSNNLTATFAEINSSLDGNTATASEITNAAAGIGVTIPRQKVIEIGDWNMDSTAYVEVAHGLTLSKIIGVRGMIRDDTDALKLRIGSLSPSSGFPESSISDIDATNIKVERLGGGYFDSTGFDSTSFNRGWLIVDYLD
jgi:hypothetical protein